MKSMGGSGEMVSKGAVTPEEALRYAMSLPVATTISGMNSVSVLRQNLAIARNFRLIYAAELQGLRDRCRSHAADGVMNCSNDQEIRWRRRTGTTWISAPQSSFPPMCASAVFGVLPKTSEVRRTPAP